MKDIKLDTLFKKIQYWISWFGFIIGGTLLAWIVALYLASYGKVTSLDIKSKKNLLNKTWQKFIFIYGLIIVSIIIIGWSIIIILSVVGFLFG